MNLFNNKPVLFSFVFVFVVLICLFYFNISADMSKNKLSKSDNIKIEKKLINHNYKAYLDDDLDSKIKEVDALLESTERNLKDFQQETLLNKNLRPSTNQYEISKLKNKIDTVKKTISNLNENLN